MIDTIFLKLLENSFLRPGYLVLESILERFTPELNDELELSVSKVVKRRDI